MEAKETMKHDRMEQSGIEWNRKGEGGDTEREGKRTYEKVL